jgi:hypothetical protein
MLPDFSPYLTNPKFHFTLNQFNSLTLSSDKKFLVASCAGGFIIFNNFNREIINVLSGLSESERVGLHFINNRDELISYGGWVFSIWNFSYRWQEPFK